MKKTSKIILSALLIASVSLAPLPSAVPGISVTASAAAAQYNGTYQNMTWSFERETGTLTLGAKESATSSGNSTHDGIYYFRESNGNEHPAPWESYRNQINAICLEPEYRIDENDLSYFQMFDEFYCEDSGARWAYDKQTDTLTLSSDGSSPYQLENFNIYAQWNRVKLDGSISQTNLVWLKANTVILGENVSTYIPAYEEYIVDDNNSVFSSYDGCLYSNDYSEIIQVPFNKTSIDFHPDLTTIKYNSITCKLDGPMIVPWGVTTIESASWDFGDMTIVLPDTVTSIGNYYARSANYIYIFSKNNQEAIRTIQPITTDSACTTTPKQVDSVASYYGILPSSFKTFGSKTYYFDADCKMVTGTQTINGKTYIFDQNGVLQEEGDITSVPTGIVYQDGKTYIYDENGNMLHSGWYQAEGNWYYLNDNGAGVVKCWRLKDGKYVYLGADGKMKTSCWIQDYNDWYYVKADGTRYESTWAKIGGSWYWFGGSGKMMSNGWLKLADGKWYFFRSSGQMATGWVKEGNKWYYLTGSGAMAANKWVKSGSYWYYLGSSGAMLTNTITPDGYRVDSEGRWE